MPAHQVSRQSLSGRYLTLFGGESLAKIGVLVAFAYLARVLGPADFGRVELSLSVTLFFLLGVECGLGTLGARLVAARPEDAPALLARAILIKAVLAVPAFVLLVLLSATYGMPGLGILAIYGGLVLLLPLHNQWVFQGFGRMRWVAAGTALRYIVFALLVLVFVRPPVDARYVPVAEIGGVLALVALDWAGRRLRLGVKVDWRGAWSGAWRLAPQAWPLAASQLAAITVWQLPEVILGIRSSPEELAWLAAALRIVLAVNGFVSLYFFNLLPGLARAYHESDAAGRALTNQSLATSTWVGGLIAGAGTIMAPFVIRIVFGAGYEPAAGLLQIGIWMIPLTWLAGHFRYVLIATGHQRLEFIAVVSGAAATALIALALVPVGGGGAAIAFGSVLAGGLVMAGLAAAAVTRVVGPLNVLEAMTVPALAVVVALAAGLGLSILIGPLMATTTVFAVYGVVAMRRDGSLIRLRHAWLRR